MINDRGMEVAICAIYSLRQLCFPSTGEVNLKEYLAHEMNRRFSECKSCSSLYISMF